MTQIVAVLCCKHRFQYVERKYSGFVALSFVAVLDARLGDVRNQWVKSAKKIRLPCFGGATPGVQAALIWQIDKIILPHGNH
jgi:hypothetical protein